MVKLNALETPCLVLDWNRLRRNIAALHTRMQRLGVNLRPHGKTAKNIEVVKLAIAGQDGGITVSTLKEAEYYCANGIEDLVYAVGVAPVKLNRIAALIKKGARLKVILDSMDQARILSERAQMNDIVIPALIEIDSDGHRSGVLPDEPRLIEIGRFLHARPHTELQGVLTHAGASYDCRSVETIRAMADKERDAAVHCADRLRRHDLPCPTVSVGSTPTANLTRNLDGITEVRAGVFMFYDLVMAGLGVCTIADIALSVLASVIGHQNDKGWIITDAGWMALSRDRGTASQAIDQGYGLVCDINGRPLGNLIVSGANQEHGILADRSGTPDHGQRLRVGDMVRILPNHACATGAMHAHYQVVEDGSEVVAVLNRVNGW
jgi:D-serine deaminase-like pyridoxal phosphate-dependent protein